MASRAPVTGSNGTVLEWRVVARGCGVGSAETPAACRASVCRKVLASSGTVVCGIDVECCDAVTA